MKAKVHITLKRGVLDPQGKAIAHALNNLGFAEVVDARQGKVIELELGNTLEGQDSAQINAQINAMCQKLLANTVIEDYRFELIG